MRFSLTLWAVRLVDLLTLAAIAVCLLLFGGVWGVGFAVTFGLLASAFSLWAVSRAIAGEPGGANRAPVAPAALPVRSILVWLLPLFASSWLVLQIVPLPVSLVQAVSPERVEQAELIEGLLPEFGSESLTLAVSASNSRRALLTVVAALMAFVLGMSASTHRSRARGYIVVLLLMLLVEALYGLSESLTGQAHALWYSAADGASASGTFINRNHYAALLSIFFPVSIGWFLFSVGDSQQAGRNRGMLPPTAWDRLGSRQGMWMLVPCMLAVSVIQSHSRGGFSTLLLGVGLFLAIGARRTGVRTVSIFGIALALALFAFGVNSDHEELAERFDQVDEGAHGRLAAWGEASDILADYPIAGIGLANYTLVYPQYSRENNASTITHAENEWLEGFVAVGYVGMAPVVIALLLLFAITLRRIENAGNDMPWVLGIWCGLLGLALHSAVEGILHLPAIVLIGALLAGLLLGITAPANKPNA